MEGQQNLSAPGPDVVPHTEQVCVVLCCVVLMIM